MIKQDLIDFERECAEHFNAGKIRAPLHLSGGNEDQLIELFQRIKPHDWVFSTWRSHYHALLHGVPREQLMAKVLAGESISINVPERRFYSSAICGGCLPIALGVAWAIKQKYPGPWVPEVAPSVWCFVGDMASRMGAFDEATRYAANFKLPISFVIEDNKKCVNILTREAWGKEPESSDYKNVCHYEYQLSWPHMGTGIRVEFPEGHQGPQHGGM